MFVAVEDHAELGAPVADMVIARGLMPQEPQHAAQSIADHGRTNMADVHRLGHVRRRVIDHERARMFRRWDAKPAVAQGRRKPLDQPVAFQSQIDEARPGDFGFLTQVGQIKSADDLSSHLAMRAAQLLAQRHRHIGLIVAELGILTAADLL